MRGIRLSFSNYDTVIVQWTWVLFKIQHSIQCKEPIPGPAINIDTSVNPSFTADKLNAAKSSVDITDC